MEVAIGIAFSSGGEAWIAEYYSYNAIFSLLDGSEPSDMGDGFLYLAWRQIRRLPRELVLRCDS